jgi:hypothetical protein
MKKIMVIVVAPIGAFIHCWLIELQAAYKTVMIPAVTAISGELCRDCSSGKIF